MNDKQSGKSEREMYVVAEDDENRVIPVDVLHCGRSAARRSPPELKPPHSGDGLWDDSMHRIDLSNHQLLLRLPRRRHAAIVS